MKKLLALAALGAAFAIFDAAFGEYEAVRLEAGDNAAPYAPCRIVAARAAATNQTGSVTLSKATPFTVRWLESEIATNTFYEAVETNLYRTVTNDYVTLWRTTLVGNGVIETNFYDIAVNETPKIPPFPGMVVTTNTVIESESYTNWTYLAEIGEEVVTNLVPHMSQSIETNVLASLVLSSGFAGTNGLDAIVFPGEYLKLGTPGDTGDYWIVIER